MAKFGPPPPKGTKAPTAVTIGACVGGSACYFGRANGWH
jgi:hypothetical protein